LLILDSWKSEFQKLQTGSAGRLAVSGLPEIRSPRTTDWACWSTACFWTPGDRESKNNILVAIMDGGGAGLCVWVGGERGSCGDEDFSNSVIETGGETSGAGIRLGNSI